MEKFIEVNIHPFIMGQHIYVLNKDGDVIDKVVVDFDSTPDKIIEIAKINEVKNIHLCGNKAFTEKIKEKIYTSKKFSSEDNFVITID